MIIFGISFFFLIGITAVMIYFVFRYSKKRNPVAAQISGNNTLEIIWTVIPLILVMVMFFYGYKGFITMRRVPEGARVVNVTAFMWGWEFQYENGKKSKELFLPVNEPVKLNLHSLDVIHSLYIPSFRIKEDVVPGKQNYMWFIPELKGSYEILCAEYCGLRHSYMESKVHVLPKEEFDTWLADFQPEAKDPKGLDLIKSNACVGCHSLDGSKLVGPSFKGFYGNEHQVITDGKERTITADDEYIKKSILEPNADVAKGYPGHVMQSYRKSLTDEDIQQIIDYLKSDASK